MRTKDACLMYLTLLDTRGQLGEKPTGQPLRDLRGQCDDSPCPGLDESRIGLL
jgi:hypothetical protein